MLRFATFAPDEDIWGPNPPNGSYLPMEDHLALTRAQCNDLAANLVAGVRIRMRWYLPEHAAQARTESVTWNGTCVNPNSIRCDRGCNGAPADGALYTFPPPNFGDRLVALEWVAVFRIPAVGIPQLPPMKRAREIDEAFVDAMEIITEKQQGDDTGPKRTLVDGLRVPAQVSTYFRWTYTFEFFGRAKEWKEQVKEFKEKKVIKFADPRYAQEWMCHIDCIASLLGVAADSTHLRKKDDFYHIMYLSARLVALAVLGAAKTKAGENYEKAKAAFDDDWQRANTVINFERYFRINTK